MIWKSAARSVLHGMGGLTVLRKVHQNDFGIVMFHSFAESAGPGLTALCEYISRYFHPVSLSAIVTSLRSGTKLPPNAVAVTVDDGYRNFLTHGHPLFRRYNIPTTIYAVSDFANADIWLWPDIVEFAISNTGRRALRVKVGSRGVFEASLTSPDEKAEAIARLSEILKEIPSRELIDFAASIGDRCEVEIPATPPPDRTALSWDELRTLASDGVEIGCHTQTHPILSRVSSLPDLEREIGGAKKAIERNLGRPVRHFCYPNGRPIDISDAARACVRQAGFESAVTCSWGMNKTNTADPFELKRLPFYSTIDLHYGAEILAGLHL